MRILNPTNLFIFLSVFTISLFSCTSGSCFEETESYLKASLFSSTLQKNVAPDSLTVYGLNRDSAIYYRKTGIKVALFPLDASNVKCTFVVTINTTIDTIEFSYNSYPHLISKECGYTYYHYLNNLPAFTKHCIKKIEFGSKTVTNLNIENLRIYY